jgi:glycosyltransferase involved in cell wall biosynthesis
MMPKISVAMTTYNCEHYIQAQLESIIQQSLAPFEIIICDDGSTDKTKDILASYQAKHPHLIKLNFNATNLGLNSNFGHAFSLCSGDFIAPSDHDDVWLPNKLQRLYDEIGDFPLIHSDSAYINQDGALLGFSRRSNFKLETMLDPFVYVFNNSVAGHAMLIRRTLLNKCFPFDHQFPNDWWLAIAGANQGGVKFLDEVLVHYRIHEKNVSDPLKRNKKKKYNSIDKNREKIRVYRFMIHSGVLRPEVKAYLEQLVDLYQQKENIWFFHFSLYRKLLEREHSIHYLIQKSEKKKRQLTIKDSFGLRIKRLFY